MTRLCQDHPEALALVVILLAFFAAGEAVQVTARLEPLLLDSRTARAAIDGPARIAVRGDQLRARLEQRLQNWQANHERMLERLHLRFEERLERGRRRVHLISDKVSQGVCGRAGRQPALRFE